MNNELNKHYNVLLIPPGRDRSANLFFWKKDIYVCKFFRAMVPESPRFRRLVLKCYVNGSHSVKHFSMAAFLWFLGQAALAMQH